MTTLPLHLRDGHLFLETAGALWLVDTGAPTSVGSPPSLTLAGERFELSTSYLGLTPADLSRFMAIECAGLLGADVLGRFDALVDVPGGRVTLSTDELEHGGLEIPLDWFMGIPVVSARVRGADHRVFLDTGAQISYFQHGSLATFPSAGVVTDFYPGFGQFDTETYDVDIAVGGVEVTLRSGALPALLGATLMIAGAAGIVGNQLFRDRSIGYFPRRGLMVL